MQRFIHRFPQARCKRNGVFIAGIIRKKPAGRRISRWRVLSRVTSLSFYEKSWAAI